LSDPDRAEPTDPGPLPERGLTPAELATVVAELGPVLVGATVAEVGLLAERDDLLLFVDTPAGRHALQIAPEGRRARICTTRRRLPRQAFASGPRVERVAALLRGAVVRGLSQAPGERRCTIRFDAEGGPRCLHAELFGNRGLWTLCDADGLILALSRLPQVKDRDLRPGARYEPPASRAAAAAEPPPRFASPGALEAVDRAFTAADRAAEADAERDAADRALARELAKRRHRLEGLRRQRDAMDRADELRRDADLLLAYGPSLRRGATELRAPDPERPGEERTIACDPALPFHLQAQALYRKARKLADGRETADRQIEEADAALRSLEALAARFATEGIGAVRPAFEESGLLRPARPPQPDPVAQKIRKLTGGENFRRFESVEGMLILVGRDNRQNDRLSTRVARGNDLWLHVGRGYAGSHVVVRVPKGHSASLETLLDAATLAIHFSKVRGAALEEVVYTQAKNVRKAKGMPAGKVLATQTRSLRVRLEPDRLQRLLSSSATSDPTTR
jgi:predicted ribosome quality control (RQC) complex YloA/Tae2 family protein